MSSVLVVVNGTPRNVEVPERGGVSVGGLKSAVEKVMKIPRDKQRVFVGLLDVTKCEDSKTFCTYSCGDINIVDDACSCTVPEYYVETTDFEGKSREALLQPSPDITQLKAQLIKDLGLDVTDPDAFEAICDKTGVLNNDGMWMFKPWNTLRLVHCPFKMNCTIVRTDTGKSQHVEAAFDPKWHPLMCIHSLKIPMGEYKVTVDGKPCNDWCHELTWGAGARDGSLFHVDVLPSPGFQINVYSLSGKRFTIDVHGSWTIEILQSVIFETQEIPCSEQRIIFKEKQLELGKTLYEYDVFDNATLHLVLRLRGGKPVILFFPPTSGPHAKTKSFVTTTSVTLHNGCKFTTLLPRPKHSVDGHTVTWNAILERPLGVSFDHPSSETATTEGEGDERPGHVRVNGRKHSYLFWEFENDGKADTETTDEVSRLVGYRSLLDHVDSLYVVKSMDEYEDWCDTVLGMIGLGVRERDDFATYWARMIEESGPFVILHVVPEDELSKCARLCVDAHSADGDDDGPVSVRIRRVYVTMLATKKLPKDFEEHKDRLCCEWHHPLPKELGDCYPIVKTPESLMVIEWGGVLLTL